MFHKYLLLPPLPFDIKSVDISRGDAPAGIAGCMIKAHQRQGLWESHPPELLVIHYI